MPERKIVVDQLRINYDGLFKMSDLYLLITDWFKAKGYDKGEDKNYEQVLPTGKDIEIELKPWKKRTDYVENNIKVRLYIKNMKDVEVDKDGAKFKMNQGWVMIVIDAHLKFDYTNKWDTPLLYFIRTIFDQFIYKKYSDNLIKDVVDDVHNFHTQVKTFLNMQKYPTRVPTPV